MASRVPVLNDALIAACDAIKIAPSQLLGNCCRRPLDLAFKYRGASGPRPVDVIIDSLHHHQDDNMCSAVRVTVNCSHVYLCV